MKGGSCIPLACNTLRRRKVCCWAASSRRWRVLAPAPGRRRARWGPTESIVSMAVPSGPGDHIPARMCTLTLRARACGYVLVAGLSVACASDGRAWPQAIACLGRRGLGATRWIRKGFHDGGTERACPGTVDPRSRQAGAAAAGGLAERDPASPQRPGHHRAGWRNRAGRRSPRRRRHAAPRAVTPARGGGVVGSAESEQADEKRRVWAPSGRGGDG